MAIKHLYTVICDKVIQDVKTSNLTLVDVYSNIILDSIPGGKSILFVVVGFSGDEGEEFTVTLEGPGKYKKKPFEVAKGKVVKDSRADSPHGALVTFAAVGIKGLSFDAEGLYYFVLRQAKKVIHKTPMGVFVSELSKEMF
jgi:hypothetical protein